MKIGSRVIIHSGAVIGSDGFGYVMEKGMHYKIPQVGGVIIGDDVEIGANVTIDRATTGNTIIGRGTKIDNLVQIAHNVKIGENSIDDGVMVGAQSGAMGHVKKGIYSGSPMIPHRDWLKSIAIFAKLPELNKTIKKLEDIIKNIERREQR
ncbi:MAG: hypothetical protein NTW44_01905 [Nitrospirae bacterium]|nr:hypothetical protein [Nitrospirota bacterium]